MNTKVIGMIAGAIVIIGGITWIVNNQKMDSTKMMEGEEGMMQKETMEKNAPVMEKDKMMGDSMQKDDAAMKNESLMDGGTMMKGGYMDYAPEKLSFAEKGKVVLFFKASWCPTCQALDKDIAANLSKIPTDVLILKVDYDNSSELKKKYNVLGQHTLVQVDKDGNAKAMWRGSATLSELLGEL